MLADEFADREFGGPVGELLVAPAAPPAPTRDAGLVIEQPPWVDQPFEVEVMSIEQPTVMVDALSALKGYDPPDLDLGPPMVTPPLLRVELPAPDWREVDNEARVLNAAGASATPNLDAARALRQSEGR